MEHMAESEQSEIKVGDIIPPFLVKDHEGFEVTDEDVLGTPLVIYFYPKNDTPACTDEACFFRDGIEKFDELQALVLGVSPDTVESHQAFVKKHKLPFSLLSDEKKDMFRSFGALKGEGVVRATFVANSDGEIVWMEKPVDVPGHVERVVQALEKYCKNEVVSFDEFDRDYEEFLNKSLGEDAPDQKKIRKEIMDKFNLSEKDLKKKK
jgi:thioredoxin-dependent peroxiredoxin